nr:uncharacterized protein LOC110358996 isoform X2 [Columba livia]
MELGWLRWDRAAQHHGVLRPSQRTFPRGSSSWQLPAPCSSWHHNREKIIPSGVTSAQWPESTWRQLEKLPRKAEGRPRGWESRGQKQSQEDQITLPRLELEDSLIVHGAPQTSHCLCTSWFLKPVWTSNNKPSPALLRWGCRTLCYQLAGSEGYPQQEALPWCACVP